jgi:hypothetical protein
MRAIALRETKFAIGKDPNPHRHHGHWILSPGYFITNQYKLIDNHLNNSIFIVFDRTQNHLNTYLEPGIILFSIHQSQLYFQVCTQIIGIQIIYIDY